MYGTLKHSTAQTHIQYNYPMSTMLKLEGMLQMPTHAARIRAEPNLIGLRRLTKESSIVSVELRFHFLRLFEHHTL